MKKHDFRNCLMFVVFWGVKVFGNDPEPYGFVSEYEPISSHMDPFHSTILDFHAKTYQDHVQDLVQDTPGPDVEGRRVGQTGGPGRENNIEKMPPRRDCINAFTRQTPPAPPDKPSNPDPGSSQRTQG